MSADVLRRQFQRFREQCRDDLLRQSYPTDMHHFNRAFRPQASTRDIILSFMDSQYHDLKVDMVDEIAARLDAEVAKKRTSSELEKILAKERARRFGKGAKAAHTYWGLNRAHLEDKYAGLYALLRVDSSNRLQAEPFALVLKAKDPTQVSVYWMCESHGRVGDLIVNTFRFSGLTVRKSTDAVVEPVSISLLRAPRKRRDGQILPLVMGGFIVGWKEGDYTALFHSRVALIKLALRGVVVDTYKNFLEAIELPQAKTILQDLRRLPAVRQQLMSTFLSRSDLAMTQSEASDAVPDLESGQLTLEV